MNNSGIIGIHSGRTAGISEQALRYFPDHCEQESRVIALNELSLTTCDACLGCASGNCCVKNDGLAEVFDALKQSSAVVFAAPEYWGGVHAKARAFCERVCFMGRHNELFPLRHLSGVIIGVSGSGSE
jgi:multimeric flavodoxin WrbA